MSDETVDLRAVGEIQQRTWSEGDFAMVANLVVGPSEDLAEALELVPDERVLDVACGSGNATIATARRTWGGAVGVDFVPALLERGRERAAAERLDVEFVEGDATALPFEDASFDVVTSVFGAMFAADQESAAAELLRVCRPGGRIGMANWVPDSGVGNMFRAIAEHAPPPPGVPSPLRWGTEEGLRELLGDGIGEMRLDRLPARQPFRSADHFLEFFRAHFGPIRVAFERVGPDGEAALEADLRRYLEESAVDDPRALAIAPEYLRVIARRA